ERPGGARRGRRVHDHDRGVVVVFQVSAGSAGRRGIAADDMNRHTQHEMSSRVGERGQITIEKSIRDELAIYAGDETIQRVEDGRIVIEVIPGRHRRSLAGVLRHRRARTPTDESWDAIRQAAWETLDPDRS